MVCPPVPALGGHATSWTHGLLGNLSVRSAPGVFAACHNAAAALGGGGELPIWDGFYFIWVDLGGLLPRGLFINFCYKIRASLVPCEGSGEVLSITGEPASVSSKEH